MAKPLKDVPEQEGEISVSMVKFTMKGSDATLQKGLDTIKAAFAQAGFVGVTERRLPSQSSIKQDPTPVESVDAEFVDEARDAADIEDVTLVAPPVQKKSAILKKQPNYRVLSEIYIDDVSPALAEFVLERHADTELGRYLVIAYWFKHIKKLEDLTVEHWFTAYKLLGWTPPKDPGQPVADLRSKRRQHLSAGKEKGTSTINNVGESIVMGLSKASD